MNLYLVNSCFVPSTFERGQLFRCRSGSSPLGRGQLRSSRGGLSPLGRGRGRLFCLCALVPLLLFITGCIQSKPYIKPYDYHANRESVGVYEKALVYEKEGSLELAIAEFRHYLDYYGSLYHANEAQLKIAECYQTLSQWDEAISNYRIYIKEYKGSEKIPEAMFQIGACLETTNQWKEAVTAYKRLIKNHFVTDWSQKAQERIAEILKKFPKAQWARKEKIAVRTLVRTMSRK